MIHRLRDEVWAVLLVAVLQGATSNALASLRWEKTTIAEVARVGVDKVDVTFRFTNDGKSATSIMRVESDCGCTVAHVEQKKYQPGEQGSIGDSGEVTGTQVRSITVHTDDGATPAKVTVQVTVPAWAEITPRLLQWNKDDALRPKQA